MRKYLYIVLGLLCLLSSCKKEDAKPVDWTEYYPLTIGTTRIYECKKITIDVPADIHDTATFLLRETVKSLISETKNCKTFAENCEIKEEGSNEWKPYFSLSVQQYDHAIVRVKDNVPLQVLKFPAKIGFTWDLNEFNTLDEQRISYSAINFINDNRADVLWSDSTLEVTQSDFKSLYTYQYAVEKYGKNVGMIYKKTIDVESQPNHAKIDLTKDIEERITKGTISTFSLKQFTNSN